MIEKSKFWEDLKSGRFASMVKESTKGQSLSNSREAYNILKPLFAEEDDIEQVYIIFLNSRNKILLIDRLFTGSLSSATIYPREIIKKMISTRANALLMAHNHPSGETFPSPEDAAMTFRVSLAAAAIDAQLHDHLIIGNGYFSMADKGLMKQVNARCAEVMSLQFIL